MYQKNSTVNSKAVKKANNLNTTLILSIIFTHIAVKQRKLFSNFVFSYPVNSKSWSGQQMGRLHCLWCTLTLKRAEIVFSSRILVIFPIFSFVAFRSCFIRGFLVDLYGGSDPDVMFQLFTSR